MTNKFFSLGAIVLLVASLLCMFLNHDTNSTITFLLSAVLYSILRPVSKEAGNDGTVGEEA